jgi:peptide/nickel transport system substrate-binding protein
MTRHAGGGSQMKKFSKLLNRRVAAAALACMMVVAATGCGSSTVSSSGGSAAPVSGGTITYGRPASTTSFDIYTQITTNNAFAVDKIFETLVTFDKNGKITDWLAKSHSVSSDGLTYTFVLRDGLKFSDGKAVTAKDAAFSIEHHLSVGGPLAIDADVESVTAQNDSTLVIKLKKAYTPFISELANFSNGIVPDNFNGKSEADFFKNPVGTGPFVVEKWSADGDLTFKKNTNYWQKGKPYIDKLVYKVISDDTQSINQLKAGQVDAIERVSCENAKDLSQGGSTKLLENTSWETEQVFFNTLDKHFSDVHVRRALALAIDRAGLTKAVTFGYGKTANSLLPTTITYNTDSTVKALNYNVAEAKNELAKSPYPKGFATKLLISSDNNARMQEAQIIQAAGKAIGIQIDIDSVEIASFRERFFKYDYSMMINSGQADYPDANSIIAFQVDPSGFSKCYWTHYSNSEMPSLLAQSQSAPDGDQRAKVYAQIQQILADEVPYIPLYYTKVLVGASSRLNGLTVLPNGSVRFENAYISK